MVVVVVIVVAVATVAWLVPLCCSQMWFCAWFALVMHSGHFHAVVVIIDGEVWRATIQHPSAVSDRPMCFVDFGSWVLRASVLQ